jgi:predicted NUDIX family NTP pyrophosphohydrolase
MNAPRDDRLSVDADFDTASLISNSFEIEGRPAVAAFPEVDRAAWLDLDTDRSKIQRGQTELPDELEKCLA